MSQVRLIKLKFKPGKKQVWLDWCEELKRRTDEVMATLKDEGMLSEAVFISQDGETIYYFIEAKDMSKAKEAYQKSAHAIDQEHRDTIRTSLEKIEEMECLVSFENRF